MATLTELKTAADTASTKLYAAQARLETARADVIQASAAQHQAILNAVTDQPPAPAPAPAPAGPAKARTASVPAVDPVAAAAKRVADALAAYEQVRRDLGLT
jgi:hypothetical protein